MLSRSPISSGSSSALARTLADVLSLCVGFVLFGDYLALSLSRALTGNPGNWILCTALVQAVALALALALGRLRGRLLGLELLGFGILAAVMLIHFVDRALSGAPLGEYGVDKLVAFLGVCGPSLLLGVALGRGEALAGARWLSLWLAPLLAMVALALATDPHLITIAHFADLGVFFGILVLPAHQALAYCLAKSCLMTHAQACGSAQRSGALRALRFALVGALVGLTLLAGARGYGLALCAALALQWTCGRARFGATLIAVLLAAFLLNTFTSDLLTERYDPDEIGGSISYLERQRAWENAGLAFLERPLFGHGPGGFAEFVHAEGRVYPHNLFLEVASECGAIGLVGLLLMLVPIGSRVFRAWRGAARPDGLGLFAIGLFAFALVGSLAVGDLIRNHFLFLALGMTIGCARTAPRPALRAHRARARAFPEPTG